MMPSWWIRYAAPPMLQPPTFHWLSVSMPRYAAYAPARWKEILAAPLPALLASSWPSLEPAEPTAPVAMVATTRALVFRLVSEVPPVTVSVPPTLSAPALLIDIRSVQAIGFAAAPAVRTAKVPSPLAVMCVDPCAVLKRFQVVPSQ